MSEEKQEVKLAFEELSLDTEDNRKAIVNFYTLHYAVPSYLLPTDEGLQKTGRRFFALHDGEQVIAMTSVEIITNNLLKSWSTVVKSERRREGFGTIVNKYLEALAEQNGFRKISCHVYVDNLPSVVLKLKQGYLVEGLLRNHDELGQHEYLMSKELEYEKHTEESN